LLCNALKVAGPRKILIYLEVGTFFGHIRKLSVS